jgi:hypothetical protein
MHPGIELDDPKYPMATITADLDMIHIDRAPAPSLERHAADATNVARNRRESDDYWLNDGHVVVIGFAV